MNWPRQEKGPAPPGRGEHRAKTKKLSHSIDSRSGSRAQDRCDKARVKFAKDAVHSEFGKAGRALDQGDFVDRKPWQAPRPSPEVWRITRG